MKIDHYMILRKAAVVWVPLTMWNEVQNWENLGKASLSGFTRPQALEIINGNRKWMPKGTRYCLMPMDQFLTEELE